MAIEIDIDFPKVNHRQTNYDLEYFSDCITGKTKSLFEDRPGAKSPKDEETLCGFYLPPFQRPEVWDEERKIKLIESLFCEISVGSIAYVSNYACPEVDGWLIDGQQRLSAIRDFTLGKFAVFDGRLSYGNMREVMLNFPLAPNAAEKQVKARNIWRRNSIPCLKIENVSDKEVLKQLYLRLNFGGVAHEEEELRELQGMRM